MAIRGVLLLGLLWPTLAGAQLSWKDWLPPRPVDPRSRQRESAQRLRPARLQLGRAPAVVGTPRTLKVRVHAAADFRRQTRSWRQRFLRMVERVNGAARAWPGVRFEVVEVRAWERESGETAMGTLLDELTRLDPGDDVDVVVGLIAALPVFPGVIDHLGMARLFSRHLVIRSLHELAEYEAVRTQYEALLPAEREALLAVRKIHKEQELFLHEWAHTLGLIHRGRAAAIMHPRYDHSRSGFDEIEQRFIERALQGRVADGARGMETSRADLRDLVEGTPDPDWDPRDRAQLLSLLSGRGASMRPRRAHQPPAVQAPPLDPPSSAPRAPSRAKRVLQGADLQVFEESLRLARAGKHDAAWDAMARIEARYPDHAALRALLCELAWRRPSAGHLAITQLACGTAARLAPRDPRVQLYLAEAHHRGGEVERGVAHLLSARALFEERTLDREMTGLLLTLLEEAGLPTYAEQTASRLGLEARSAVDQWASALRRRFLLPVDLARFGVSADAEAVYLRGMRKVQGARGAEVSKAAETLAAELKRLPVLDLLHCQEKLDGRRLAAARAACARLLQTRATASLAELRASFRRLFVR